MENSTEPFDPKEMLAFLQLSAAVKRIFIPLDNCNWYICPHQLEKFEFHRTIATNKRMIQDRTFLSDFDKFLETIK